MIFEKLRRPVVTYSLQSTKASVRVGDTWALGPAETEARFDGGVLLVVMERPY